MPNRVVVCVLPSRTLFGRIILIHSYNLRYMEQACTMVIRIGKPISSSLPRMLLQEDPRKQ